MIQFLHNGFTYRTNNDASVVEGHDGKKWNRTHSLGVRDAALQAIELRQIGERIGTRGGTYKPPWLVTEDEPSKKKPKKFSRHHATKKSPAQLDREIAEVLGRWEEDPFGGYRFITMSDGVRFDTAGVDPTYHRDPKWRQRWEFDLKREIEKFKAGKPTKLYKMSETHYRLPGTV